VSDRVIWSDDAVLTFNSSVSFLKGKVPPVILRNFFPPEDGFVWSTSTWSEVIFSFSDSTLPNGRSADLILDLDVFKAPPALPHQTVLIYLNGLRIGSRDVSRRATVVFTFNPALLKATENVLTFDTPKASMPSNFGVSDGRCLGMQLFSLQLRPGG
jgi:hypothetical protein